MSVSSASINKTPCATQDQLDVYNSNIYTIALIFNVFLTVVSFIVSAVAIRRLLSESIIQASIRIFLIMGVCCCLLHQTAYMVLRIQVIYQIFFKLDQPCELYYKASECQFVTFGLVIGNCGICFVQTAMSIDRIVSILFTRIYIKLTFYPGIVLSIAVLVCMLLVYFILFHDDPMTDYVANCGNLPPKSVGRFMVFLSVTFYLSIANIVINVLALFWNIWQDKKQRNTFDVNERYQARVALKSTQAIFLLTMTQFLLTFAYSVFTEILLETRSRISALQYNLILALIYSSLYTCIINPSVIICVLSYIRNQRQRSINTMTSQTETQEEHISKMRKMWS